MSKALKNKVKLNSFVNAVAYGVPNDGTTATTAIQSLFDEAATTGKYTEIHFPAGTYSFRCNRTDNDFTCAIVARNLENVKITGTKGTIFKLESGGSGAAEFGFIRFEQCVGIEIHGIEFDGSGIPAQGLGANRSRGIVLCNHDVNNITFDYSPCQRFHIHHNYFHDMGGGIITALRSEISNLPTFTENVLIHDNLFYNIIGQDHVIGMIYAKNIQVFNNRAINNIPTVTPIDNMFIDVSAGCENAHVHNNYIYGFTYGMKAESRINLGIGLNEVRTSKRVVMENNYFDQIGLPDRWDWPGAGGGDTYGIRANGQDIVVRNNTIKPRTIGVTGGGLSIGILLFNSHGQETHCVVENNTVYPTRYGVVHNHSGATEKFTGVIRDNRLNDSSLYGVVAQANVIVEDNWIYRSGKSAVIVQSPSNTIIRRNRAINCASLDNDVTPDRVVFYQEGAGAQGFQEWTDNVIIDDRGASAGEYGYLIRGGTTYTNALLFRPGYTTGLVTATSFDRYFSNLGDSLQLAGTLSPARRIIRSSGIPSSTSPWSTMPWVVGDRAEREVPTVGQPKAWVCTVAGTPGTWVSEGNL